MRRFFLSILLLTCSLLLPAYTFADTTYVIKKGDSLYKISKKFKVSIREIKNNNELISSRLKPGTEIIIPTKDKKQETTLQISSVKHNSSKPNTEDKASVRNAEDEPYHYTVRKGDTLLTISKKFSVPVTEIREMNDLRSTKLKPGQQLIVKRTGPRTYTVQKGDNIYKIARKFDIDVDELKGMNDLETDILKPGQKLFLEPQAEPDETTTSNYEAILSQAQIDKEIQGVTESEETSLKDKLILFARKFINIPYRFGGNSLLGIDCSAFVQKVYGMIGVNLPRSAREQFHEGIFINSAELSIGDLVFFRTYAPFPSHVGIYLGDNLFIHASSKGKRVTINSLMEPYYFKRFIGAKRVIGEDTIDGG
ncbi:MAG TPA: LysM peptidoglycan-binding domain-containing protein [Thermodesulfovibrionales bacterium]|nr:LysM peptidoglycan-binding domain-containing protein [Thermodesulfovibrionales bacterium]